MLLLDLVGFSFLQHSFIGLDDGVGKVRRNLGFGLADRKRFSSIEKDVCRIAALEFTGNLLGIDSSGDIIVELRMHLRPDGSARNHGTAFRCRKHKLQTLFREQTTVRPVSSDQK